MNEQTARDLMHKGVSCVNESQNLIDAARLMRDQGIGALPICGNDNKLKGMLTDRDIVVKCLAEGLDPAACKASQFAEGKLVWIEDDASVDDVLARMEEHQIRRLPVLDGNRELVGIISQADIALQLNRRQAGELVGAVSQPG